MRCSESWLREWVNPDLTRDELCTSLTMAGLEVEEITPAAKEFTHVVIGQVLKIAKHPDAERLQVCEVDTGKEKLQIVCGAENVREGMKAPVALINAVLPDKTLIKQTEIRSVSSQGMLCSASELGLSEESQGLLELPSDAPVGTELKSYLKLDDYVIDISITPNRGDCLSIKGMAREISALTGSPLLKKNSDNEIKPAFTEKFPVLVEDKKSCPVYMGREIRAIKADAQTPAWLKEKLRRSGIRSINAAVDVTNYVMLELGQPMHAFDLDKIHQKISIRKSRSGERIALLDGTEKELDDETLVIADNESPLAIAGVMGGMDSSVTLLTHNIFLESAFFTPETVARQRQYYNLNSDSAYRFERGVDYALQKQALDRAAQLILEIAGGQAGPAIEVIHQPDLPAQKIIVLPQEKIAKVLGVIIPENEVENIFHALQFDFKKENKHWSVIVPSFRFDITLPEDLIEEIARLYGYDKIPEHVLKANLQTTQEGQKDLSAVKNQLRDYGYHEIISYSFIDKKLQTLLDPDQQPCELVNPITADMTVMRTNLWPGLVNTLIYNLSRQQHRVRLFETGTCFIHQGEKLLQQTRLGGLITGQAFPEQWGETARETDFFDVKGDVQALLSILNKDDQLGFVPEKHPALHPGQTAGIFYQHKKIGTVGALHPHVLQKLDLSRKVFVYELDISCFNETGLSLFQEISKFPEIRRDLAIVVNQAVPAREIQDTIKVIAGPWLKDIFIFDVYQGKGISPGLKSIALGFILQHPSRTLVDDEVTALVERIVSTLKGKFGAELRR